MRSWTRATTLLLSFLSLLLRSVLESFCWTLASSFSSSRKNRGFAILSPFERVANDSSPASAPTASVVKGNRLGSTSQENVAYHLLVALCLIVKVLIVPSIGL